MVVVIILFKRFKVPNTVHDGNEVNFNKKELNMFNIRVGWLCLFVFALSLTGCTGKLQFSQDSEKISPPPPANENESSVVMGKNAGQQQDSSIQVVSNPDVIPVLINKVNKLPNDYQPKDLMYPDIPFTFEQKAEKRQMRAVAGSAIEELFANAKQDGVLLLGVSAYRSHDSQTDLFNYYVDRDGYEAASTFSAVPGTSEHETGLAIDVTGGNGECAAEDCFAGTLEADWLQDRAAEFGFIIRYPKGKDSITGYQYEPWHLRYVGKAIAKEIMSREITLEEYYNVTPVNN
jgi:zinc D-Ala-D-Ala carboxypeptidase